MPKSRKHSRSSRDKAKKHHHSSRKHHDRSPQRSRSKERRSRRSEKDKYPDEKANRRKSNSDIFHIPSNKIKESNSKFSVGPPPNKDKYSKYVAPVHEVKRKTKWSDAPPKDSGVKAYAMNPQDVIKFSPGINPGILSALTDKSKFRKKIYFPKNTGVNFIGLLIGPKGMYQKRLEEESGCKILIRGK